MVRNNSTANYWISINLWNLNEIFTTESISPITFYKSRNFGNPVNRNQEKVEDENNLILFDNAVQSDILLNISSELLDSNRISEIKTDKKGKIKSFEYPKTIYLKRGLIKVIFSHQDKLNEFLNNSFLLLEVKTVNKYRSDFLVDVRINEKQQTAFYQTQLLSSKDEFQPAFDKAFNQIKGLIYGYLIGSIGTLKLNEQKLITDLSKLKNAVGSIHTEIVLSDQYSNTWLINIRKQIFECTNSYFDVFRQNSDAFDTLTLRLREVDNLNRMRCEDLDKQKGHNYKRDFEKALENLDKAKKELYKYEILHKITPIREELETIKKEEENNGKSKGKTREYYKKGTEKYDQKLQLKQLITEFENDSEYKQLKQVLESIEEHLRNYQFGFTQYDTSITDQFSRISEYLHDITKSSVNYFMSKNSQAIVFPDILFDINLNRLADYYFNNIRDYTEFILTLPKPLLGILSDTDLNLIKVSVNSILLQPQGLLGNYSEQKILDILICIGQKLPDCQEKNVLREYYRYRKGETDIFDFPENFTLANLIAFFMKINGHEQINKMVVTKNILHKQLAFMFYGAYVGFANMPKTFTNIIFDSNNSELFDYLDNYLFHNSLKYI